MKWVQVTHNVALKLGSWLVEGKAFESSAQIEETVNIPEPPAPYEYLSLHKLISRGAWGENAIWRYSGRSIRFLTPGSLLVLPGKKFDHFFRIADINSKVVLAVPEKKVAHESTAAS